LGDVARQVRAERKTESAPAGLSEYVSTLEKKSAANPSDLACRRELLQALTMATFTGVKYSQLKEKRRAQILWLIENHPDFSAIPHDFIGYPPLEDRDGYKSAKELWLKQLDASPKNAAVLKNAAQFFLAEEEDRAEDLIIRAVKVDPTTSEAVPFMALDYERKARQSASEQEKHRLALRASGLLERTSNATSGEVRFGLLVDLVQAAFDAGELSKAQQYSEELLRDAGKYKTTTSPDCPTPEPGVYYGNAIHKANIILGEVSLTKDDLKASERFLLEAGRTPGSAQLASFGPNMALAKRLLEKGDSKPVLEYFEECRKFWEFNQGKLDEWKRDVLAGKMPVFGGNLNY